MAAFPSINSSYDFQVIPTFNTAVIKYRNKVQQRIKLNSATQRYFNLRFDKLSAADKNTIRDFFIARGGRFESFTFTNPEDSTGYTLIFLADELNISWFVQQLFRLNQVQFEEVTA